MREYVVSVTPKRAITVLIFTALFLFSCGTILIALSYDAEYCEIPYDVEANDSDMVEFSSTNCPRLKTPLNGFFALYYKLDGYYQNHKEFRRSIDYNQLLGKVVKDVAGISNCRPYLKDDDGRILHPCGAVPHAVFTDRFTIFKDSDGYEEIALDESRASICNSHGVHTLFKNPTTEEVNEFSESVNFWLKEPAIRQSLNMDKPGVGEGVENSHFINWVEISATSTVQKLYGIFHAENIELPIQVRIEVSHTLPSIVKKSVVIEKRSTLGNTGHIMGVIYVIVALIITLLAAIAFAHVRNTKKDMSK